MTEEKFITDAKAILDVHIKGYVIEIISRKTETISELIVQLAVICKIGSVTPALITEILDYQIQNDKEIEFMESAIDLQDLKSEIIILQAKIQYLKGN